MRKDNGNIVEFTVKVKVIHNPSEDFTRMVTFIYDMEENEDVVDKDLDPLKKINTKEEDWRRFQESADEVSLVYRHKWNNLKSVSRKILIYQQI